MSHISGLIRTEHLHRYAWAMRFAEGCDVLDVAAGEGYGTQLIASQAKSVIGVDVDAEAVRFASSTYKGPNLRYLESDATELPLEDRSVDLVVSFETIEHLGKPEEFLDEIMRVLRDDGLLIISTPNPIEYSIIPDYSNPYHLSEMPLHEFERALYGRFSCVSFFGQSVSHDSHIVPFDDSKITGDIIIAVQDGKPISLRGSDRPKYVLAVASNRQLPEISGSIFGGFQLQDRDAFDPVVGDSALSLARLGSAQGINAAELSSLPILLDTISRLRSELAESEREFTSFREATLHHVEEVRASATLQIEQAQADAAREAQRLMAEVDRLREQVVYSKDVARSVTQLLDDAMLAASDYRARLHDKESELDAVRLQLDAVYASRSWRLTRYARRLGSIIRTL